MKKGIPVLVIAICLFLALGWWIFANRNPFLSDQERYAEQYGLQIDDYPYPLVFPAGYFETILKPGMSKSQIHTTIKGYEMVYHCKQFSEIYYFFSNQEEKAIRFEVIYDERGNYAYFRGEEPDSQTIRLEGCTEGLIEENSDE